MKPLTALAAASVLVTAIAPAPLQGAAESTPWGNLTGIRVDGQLFPIETFVCAVDPNWSGLVHSEKYNWEGTPSYTVDDHGRHTAHALLGIPVEYTADIRDLNAHTAEVKVSLQAAGNVPSAGLFFGVEVDGRTYHAEKVEPIGTVTRAAVAVGERLHVTARGVALVAGAQRIEITSEQPLEIVVREDAYTHPKQLNDPRPRLEFAAASAPGPRDLQIYFTLSRGAVHAGQTAAGTFKVRAEGPIDRQPLSFTVDRAHPGRVFEGIGGNFRYQFPDRDPAVVAYCLDHLRVAWGRTCLWWTEWQPDENVDPTVAARAGKLSPRFYRQIELARELARRGIPQIVSTWDPPAWAVDAGPRPPKGVRLNPAKLPAVAQSIARYLAYLKSDYGIEAALFSFNETDVGVEVLQSPEEHATANRIIGAEFAADGLATRMLIGDTGHGTALASRLAEPTVADPAVLRYGGAVAFHTYHGCTPDDLAAWTSVAQRADLPLMVTEGGTDSAAHRYALGFLDPWFQLGEINLYLRIAATAQPSTFLEWQLTSDYSVLTGGGNYGDQGPLRPTQRFWNLKQLGSSPVGAFWLPVSTAAANVTAAACGNLARQEYAMHFVNNGATREATVSGLPDSVSQLAIYITDSGRGMQAAGSVPVTHGTAHFTLEAQTFTSLFSSPAAP